MIAVVINLVEVVELARKGKFNVGPSSFNFLATEVQGAGCALDRDCPRAHAHAVTPLLLMRYVRSWPVALSEVIVNPSFFFRAPAIAPRTVHACQPVAPIS